MKNKNNYFDVIIIGAGWSGLLACKYMKQNNLSVLVLEGRVILEVFGNIQMM